MCHAAIAVACIRRARISMCTRRVGLRIRSLGVIVRAWCRHPACASRAAGVVSRRCGASGRRPVSRDRVWHRRPCRRRLRPLSCRRRPFRARRAVEGARRGPGAPHVHARHGPCARWRSRRRRCPTRDAAGAARRTALAGRPRGLSCVARDGRPASVRGGRNHMRSNPALLLPPRPMYCGWAIVLCGRVAAERDSLDGTTSLPDFARWASASELVVRSRSF
jgi:hypothetical protein